MQRRIHREGVVIHITPEGVLSYEWVDHDGVSQSESEMRNIKPPWSRTFKQVIRDLELEVETKAHRADRLRT